MIRLCVLGPSGRMGRNVLRLSLDRSNIEVVAAVDQPGSEMIGLEIVPGVVTSADLEAGLAQADVYIDFTTPAATRQAAEIAARRGVAGVIGTTGLAPQDQAAVDALAATAPVVQAPNFSLGVNLLLSLAEKAAAVLGPEFDLEIVELHHKHKRDAPSGTALALAAALERGRGGGMAQQHGRAGDVGARPASEIGVMAVRGGDVIGDHTAHFLGPNERLELTHRAGSRAIFAGGALRAAAWAAGKPAGHYSMNDVLGL